MKKQEQFSVLNLTRQDVPIVTEDTKTRYQWVPVGILDQDDYFGMVTEAYNTSTTNAACVEGVSDLVYGKGIFTNEEVKQQELDKINYVYRIGRDFNYSNSFSIHDYLHFLFSI